MGERKKERRKEGRKEIKEKNVDCAPQRESTCFYLHELSKTLRSLDPCRAEEFSLPGIYRIFYSLN